MTRPKPFRTRHRNLNEDAINKLTQIRHLMISLISRHIQPHDQTGMRLADDITHLFLSALADLEEERRILDTGIDAKAMDADLHTLSLQYQRLEDRLADLEATINGKQQHGNWTNAQQVNQH